MQKMIQLSGSKLFRVLINYLTNEGVLPPTASNFGGSLGEALVTQKGVWGITPKGRWVGTPVLFEQIGTSQDQRINHFMEFSKITRCVLCASVVQFRATQTDYHIY